MHARQPRRHQRPLAARFEHAAAYDRLHHARYREGEAVTAGEIGEDARQSEFAPEVIERLQAAVLAAGKYLYAIQRGRPACSREAERRTRVTGV